MTSVGCSFMAPSDRETFTARAAVAYVRIVELEARTHQALDVVDLGATQQHCALQIHIEFDAVTLEGLVAGHRRIAELHEVRVPRAASAAYAEPQADFGRAARGEQALHLRGRDRSECDHRESSSFLITSRRRPVSTCSSGTKPGSSARETLARDEPASATDVIPASRAGSCSMPWSCEQLTQPFTDSCVGHTLQVSR